MNTRASELLRLPMNIAVVLVLSPILAGCGGGNEPAPPTSGSEEADQRAELHVGQGERAPQGKTLFDRLGGDAGITALVEDLTARTVADPRVNFERANVSTGWLGGEITPWKATPEKLDLFKRHMVQFLSLAAGGPTEYTGRDMRVVHKGMRITNAEFDAMVGDVKASMVRLGHAPREQRELLAIIETTRKQIVEKP